ncbi:MAG: sigma-70 family RNA polymerase sigma factor [Bacteroidetes bacterium]|nr:sigma-70 family RNA polymerase sigma factor [Bacteroidota bacterium]
MRFLISKHKNQDSDSELIEKYRDSHDNSYIGELFQRHSHLVFGVCMKYLKDEAVSQDAVMQVFEKLLTDLLKHEVTNFKSWLHSVAKNHCLMQMRKERVELSKNEEYKIIESDDMEITSYLHLNNEHHFPAEDKEQQVTNLHAAIGQLSKQQKICIEMFYLQEKCYKEIEVLTGYSFKQVKSFVQNGKRNLEKKILPEYSGARHEETQKSS